MLTTQNQNAPRTKTTYQKWEGRVMLVLVVAAVTTFIDRYMVAAAVRKTESMIATFGLAPEEARIAVCTVRYFVFILDGNLRISQLEHPVYHSINNADKNLSHADFVISHADFVRICRSADADAKKSGPPAR